MGMYNAIERALFDSLTKKISGNVLFLLLPVIGFALLGYWVYLELKLIQSILGVHAAVYEGVAKMNELLIQLGSLFLVIALISSVFSIFFLRHLLLRPISDITSVLQAVKDNDGDISASLPDYTHDEISTLAKSYNDFSTSLKQMIAETRAHSVKVSLNSNQLQKIIIEAKGSAQQQEEQAHKVFQASQEASQAISGIANHTQKISVSNDNNLGEIRSAGDEMSQVKERMRAIEHQVSDFQQVVHQLSENSNNILKVLSLVQDFSDQTNLLALNASIEAARAGEAGRGFSVVADEVRTLSQKVNDATQEIDTNIHEMVSLVENTSSGASSIMDYVTETDGYIAQTSQKFTAMINDFETVSGQMNEISAAIEELSYSNENMHEHVSEITNLSGAIKSEMELSASYSLELESSTEDMQELLSRFSIGYGGFEEILRKTQEGAAVVQDGLQRLVEKGVALFDCNYVRTNHDQLPAKFDTSYTDIFEQEMQPIYDRFIEDNPEFAIGCSFDLNGYCPAHNSKISKPMTGSFEQDNAFSRHRRMYNASRAELRRANQTSPFLLLTVIRDTGEIINSLSVPLYVNGQHWGNFCTGFKPEILLKENANQ